MAKYNMKDYSLKNSAKIRRLALTDYINMKFKKGISKQTAALSKKKYLNQLRIYRRYKYPKQCQLITSDMKWIDKMYLPHGRTNSIC